jgi:tetratricopeptide (TPR) repeat protein
MNRIATIAGIGLVAAVTLLSSGCNKLKARDNINKGVNAFKTGQYSEAADAFKTAIDLDPDLPVARLYLATAYMSQYIPGAETPENRRNGQAALDEFQKVLSTDPNNKLATMDMASMYYNMKNFDKSQEWYKKVIAIDPNNKEAYYTLGVIAWTEFVAPDREARFAQQMKLDDPGPLKPPKSKKDPDTKADLKAKYWQVLTDGLEDEKKALAIDPEYENAMAYMNLLIRYRADLDDTHDQWVADTKEADSWVEKNLQTVKAKAAKKNAAASGGTETAQQ